MWYFLDFCCFVDGNQSHSVTICPIQNVLNKLHLFSQCCNSENVQSFSIAKTSRHVYIKKVSDYIKISLP